MYDIVHNKVGFLFVKKKKYQREKNLPTNEEQSEFQGIP